MSTTTRQSKVCTIIASLAEQASYSEACRQLDPIVNDAVEEHNGCATDNDGVTPLMVSCDKANASCLQYMANKLKENPSHVTLFGDPLAKSSSKLGENSAIHFAAMNGFSNAIHLLEDINNALIATTRDPPRKVFSATNKHGDTCIMMACAGGHLAFLKGLFQMECADVSAYCTLQNHSGDSALSLACGHGHADIVAFLLSATDGPKLTVQYSDIEACKQKLASADKALSMIQANACTRKTYETKRNNVRRCLVQMQVLSAQAAQSAMEQLIAQEDSASTQSETVAKTNNPRKSKTVISNTLTKKAAVDFQKQNSSVWSKESKVEDDLLYKNIYAPRYRTLPSGAVVKHGSGTTMEYGEPEDHLPLIEVSLVTKSADDMLRERYRDPYVRQSQDAAIDSVMDSLCLKASMLLFTSHGMALGLSPSQLEAIEGILCNQLLAVKEAKEIQTRIRLQEP
jgi:ankyrin repeat protein